MTSLVILTFIFGVFTGNWWTYKQSNINQINYELEKTKYELEKVQKISGICQNLEEDVFKIAGLYKKHDDLSRELDKYPDNRKEIVDIRREIDSMWKYEFPRLVKNITKLEDMLSKLENREPDKFDFRVPPNAPMNLKISVD
jgi:hypothetical protein